MPTTTVSFPQPPPSSYTPDLLPSPPANTLHPLHISPTLQILHKPHGLPVHGSKPLVALPSPPPLPLISAPPRPFSGPIILSNSPIQTIHHFIALVHNSPTSAIPNTLSTTILRVIHAPTTIVSLLHITANHAGQGLRTALNQVGSPAVGTVARSKTLPALALKGLYICIPCVQMPHLNLSLGAGCPPKFSTFMARAERLGSAKRSRQIRNPRSRQVDGEEEVLFCGRWYSVNGCMRPRESSEVLVDVTARLLKERFRRCLKKGENAVVELGLLDLGTGCGNLLIASLEIGGVGGWGVGVDCCDSAVGTARRNVEKWGGPGVTIVKGHFQQVGSMFGQVFDLVVSNPPYLSAGEVKSDEAFFEGDPEGAIVASEGGMGGYLGVAVAVKKVVKEGGFIVVEVGGKRCGKEIREVFEKDDWQFVEFMLDAHGFERCLVMKRLERVGEEG